MRACTECTLVLDCTGMCMQCRTTTQNNKARSLMLKLWQKATSEFATCHTPPQLPIGIAARREQQSTTCEAHGRRARVSSTAHACRQQLRGDCGGCCGGGGGRRGDGAHRRDPVEENEEVVVAATRKAWRASAHVMHARTLLEAPHAKPASLRGEPRNLKLRQKATLDFATCRPPLRLPAAKPICTATACHARAAEA